MNAAAAAAACGTQHIMAYKEAQKVLSSGVCTRSHALYENANSRLENLIKIKFPPTAWMAVCCECCVLSGRVSATSWSLVHRSPTECGVSKNV
jgi:hypothetical protein